MINEVIKAAQNHLTVTENIFAQLKDCVQDTEKYSHEERWEAFVLASKLLPHAMEDSCSYDNFDHILGESDIFSYDSKYVPCERYQMVSLVDSIDQIVAIKSHPAFIKLLNNKLKEAGLTYDTCVDNQYSEFVQESFEVAGNLPEFLELRKQLEAQLMSDMVASFYFDW